MRTETLHPVADYPTELFNSLNLAEGFEGLPYFDTATPQRATIGYGFNIEVNNYLLLVLNQLGIVNSTMTQAEITRRRDEFVAGIKDTPHPIATDTAQEKATKETQLQNNLRQLANGYGVNTFELDTAQSRAVFNQILQGATIGGIPVPGKEARLDALLNNSLDHNSKEYVAVMSLYYNAESLVNSEKKLLAKAIINDNRAEAWFEIRYNTNGGSTRSQGIANRRYAESNLFDLYDTGAFTDSEAKEVARMYTKHQIQETDVTKTIQYYEQRYSPARYGYESITERIKPAADYLITTFASGKTIDGQVLVGADTGNYLRDYASDALYGTDKNDLIFGEGGSDAIYGGTGRDVIYGGADSDVIFGEAGNDTLYGGTGFDTYIVEGNDHIIDSDEKGIVKDKDGNVIAGAFIKQTDGSYTWTQNAQQTATKNSPLTLHMPDGSTVVIEDYADGGFGIRLMDAPDIAAEFGAATRTEFLKIDHYEQTVDANGNTITTPVFTSLFDDNNNSSNDAAPAIGDGNNLIYAGSGSDFVQTGSGDDQVFGEAGDDTVLAGAGNDRVYGGEGNDSLTGGPGNDTVFGEVGTSLLAA